MKITIEIPDDKVELMKKLCRIETCTIHTLNNECLHWFFNSVWDELEKCEAVGV